jgi:hypothetical protein
MMEVRTLKVEFTAGKSQFNEMQELIEFSTGNAKGKALINIRLDSAYQGEATIKLWAGDHWALVYQLLRPTGAYGYQESTRPVFTRDRDSLLQVLSDLMR